MNLDKFFEFFPKAKFVKIAPFNEEELYDENFRRASKAPLNSLKDPLNAMQAKHWVSRGGRLGWIIPKGYICLDIDNKDHERSSEVVTKLLENHSVKYVSNATKQGQHFIFCNVSDIMKKKGQFQNYINHIGIACDGRADNKGYIILPVNDEKSGREWGKWDRPVGKEFEIDDLPFWLRPMRTIRADDVSFIDLPDGSGNEALFKLRGAHSGPNMIDEEQSIECLRIINYEIWDDPMSDEIFNATVARPVENTYGNMKQVDGTGKDRPKSWLGIAQKLVDEQNLIAVGDFIYTWENDIYRKLSPHELHELIHKHGHPEATRSQRLEIIGFICVIRQVSPKYLDREYACIPCRNGYLDLHNLKLVQPNKDDYNTVRVDINFNEECQYSERIDEFMKFISKGDVDVIKQLYEIAGYTLLRRNNLHKFFILVGGGGTGKSTFVNLVRKLYDQRFISKVALSQFDQDYHLSTLIGAMVNIDDDASSDKVLKDAGRFKSITAGQPVLVRPIYSEPMELECMATTIVCANSMPKIQDDSEGLYRRMILVELNNRIKKPDRDFEYKITELDMEYFFYKSCEAIHRVLRNGRFTLEQSEDKLKQRFKVQQSSINKWCQLEFITVDRLINQQLKQVYQEYRLWCSMCGYGPFNYGNFVSSIVKQYKLELEYDKGLGDQIIVSSHYDNNYCPFEQTFDMGYS